METKFYLPLYSPAKSCDTNTKFKMLTADLRYDTSFFSYYQCENDEVQAVNERKYSNKDFNSLSAIINQFAKDEKLSGFDKVVLAVPGPVINGKCETQNLPWILEEEVLKEEVGVEKLFLINDLEATCYSLTAFEKNKLEFLHKVEHIIHGNVAILAPGHGLGEAGLFWDGESLRPFASEGGHAEFSTRDDFEIQFYQFLNKIYGIVSWENVLSKKGLYNIYRFLRDVARHQEDPEMKERMKSEDFLTLIAEIGATKRSRLVNLTIEMYAELLAREANNLALKLKSTGGLVITGDIPSQLFHLMDKTKFYKDFTISDRMQNLLNDIPLYLIRNDRGIIDGAAFYGANVKE